MYKKHPVLGYLVSENGEILKLKGSGHKKTCISKSGYECFTLKRKNYLVHRIVYETFCGQIPKGLQINHINGIKTDNRLSNLEMVTAKQNMTHAVLTGLKKGNPDETNSMAKLSKSEYLEIIQMIIDGCSNTDISNKYGLHSRYVSLIRGKKRLKSLWKLFPEIEIPLSNDQSKLSFEQRLNLLNDLKKMTNLEIAQKYHLDPSCISRIRCKKYWKQIWKVYEERCNDQSKDVDSSESKREASYL